MKEKRKSDDIPEEPLEGNEREIQRNALERVLSKTKAKLSPVERALMDDLVAELDLLHFKERDMDQRLKDSPELTELIMKAQEGQEDEEEHTLLEELENPGDPLPSGRFDLTPYEKQVVPRFPASGMARVPKGEASKGKTPKESTRSQIAKSSDIRSTSDAVAPQKGRIRRPRGVPPESKKDISPTPPKNAEAVSPESKAQPSNKPLSAQVRSEKSVSTSQPSEVSTPELTVRKFIEAWNKKTFPAEYSCFANKARTMDRNSYVERRMEVYLSETNTGPVTQQMGTIHSKRTHGGNAQILCDRIVNRTSTKDVFMENYSLCFEENEWRILEVRSSPGKSKRTPRIML